VPTEAERQALLALRRIIGIDPGRCPVEQMRGKPVRCGRQVASINCLLPVVCGSIRVGVLCRCNNVF